MACASAFVPGRLGSLAQVCSSAAACDTLFRSRRPKAAILGTKGLSLLALCVKPCDVIGNAFVEELEDDLCKGGWMYRVFGACLISWKAVADDP